MGREMGEGKLNERLDAWLIVNKTELSFLSTLFVATDSPAVKTISFNI